MIIRSLYSRPRRDGFRVSSREAERKTEFQCTSLSLPYNRPSVSVVDFTEIALKQVTATLDSLKDGNRAEPLSLFPYTPPLPDNSLPWLQEFNKIYVACPQYSWGCFLPPPSHLLPDCNHKISFRRCKLPTRQEEE